MKSAYHGHEGIVRLLLAHPMTQVDLVDCEGCSALMLATRNGHEGVVKQLHLRTEIQVNLVDDRGFSALMLAAKWGHEAIVRLLLSVSNANTASRSVDKEFTAMSLASANDHMEIVQILQEFGLQHASLPRFTDSTVKYTADPGLLSVREHLDEEMSEYVGDKAVDDEGAEDEGENNDEVRDPPPGSKGDAKRSRDNEEVLVGLVDDVAPPARKRRRGSQKAHDRWA
ncbi:ankyrin repeat-containing domain protein [Coprinopsis sp. MPI-PUGE-AT-0042]|nr:ankyrin repeat-containing domain protein [Coprinopsis sp. MPI-PUGE-AT-0042]